MKNKIFYSITSKAMIMCCLFVFCCIGKTNACNQDNVRITQNNTATPKQVIIKFLKWYKTNMGKANNFPILIKDSAGNFMVNKKACTDYLNFLKSSQCISQKYIEYWKVFFDDKATELSVHPLQSDIPEDFDFDLVLITQEPDIVLNGIDRIQFKTISMNASVALIGLKWPGKNAVQYEFEMYKTKAGWQISYISTPNFD